MKTVSELLRQKNVRTTEIYLHSVATFALATSSEIEGKFTLKVVEPPQSAAANEEGVAK
ncbi:MAG: hypothetical protein ABIJ25_10170 [Pseudomonadota bacterium]